MDPDREERRRCLNMFQASLTAASTSHEEADGEAAARYRLQGNEEMAAVPAIRADYYAGRNRPRNSHISYTDKQGPNGNVDQARLMQNPMQWLNAYPQVGHANDPSWSQHYQVQPRSTHVHDNAQLRTFVQGSGAGLDVFPPRRVSDLSSVHTIGSSHNHANHRTLDATAPWKSKLMMNSSHSQPSPWPSPEGGSRHGSALESMKRPRKRKSNYSPTPESGEPKEVTIGLHHWLSIECSSITENRDQMVVRMTSVAYAIVELMRAARRSIHRSTAEDLTTALNADNFTIFIQGDFDNEDDIGKIVGMRCSDPPSTLRMITPTFVPSTVFGSESKLVSEYLEVAVDPAPLVNDTLKADSTGDTNERDLSRQLGRLLLYIYQQLVHANVDRESSAAASGSAESLLELGHTSSVHLLVTELLGGELTLDEASLDLHVMLLAPSTFLYDKEPVLAQPRLRLGMKKLYGREDEQSAITDAFCRVATTGTSEALLIGGYSGSGKSSFLFDVIPRLSSLVETVLPYVSVAGGFVISKKFCQSTNDSSLSLVIESFNDLVSLLVAESTKEELESVANDLLSSLGMSLLTVLKTVLPTIELIFADASPETLASTQTQQRALSQATSHSVKFLLERFVCAISSSERPVLLHYDDIQWCSPQCLSLIADVLSADEKGSNCVFLICSYRDNEIAQPLLDGFTESLGRCSMPIHRIQLQGMRYEPFQNMVSDLTAMLPRHIKSLTTALYAKTKGNPFFTFRFLESLVDRKLLSYAKDAKRWTWTGLEDQEATENVVHILPAKVRKLDDETREMLRIAAAFDGLTKPLISRLGLSPMKLKMVVDEGIMRRVKSGDYCFKHDKFREASITDDETAFRHSLGMRLLRLSSKPDSRDPLLLGIADCIDADINGGLRDSDESDMLLISNLNKVAGEKAAKNSDFGRAMGYLQTALSLLPQDHWDTHHKFSIELHLALAQCAHAASNLDLAKESLREIISHGRELDDTLDAHFKLIFIINLVRGKQVMALKSCVEILGQLGEHVDSSGNNIANMVGSIRHTINSRSDAELFNFKQLGASDSNLSRRLQFLCQACLISSTGVDPKTNMYALCRSVEISLCEGYSQDTPFAFVAFGLFLCGRPKLLAEGKRLAMIAMRLFLERFNDPSQSSKLSLIYYGFFAFYVLPLRSCAEKLREASITSLGFGDVTMAISTSQQAVQKSFHAGMALTALASEIEAHIKQAVKFKDDAYQVYGRYLFKTVLVLTKEEGISGLSEAEPENDMVRMIDMYQRFIQSFWLGHYQRCYYFALKAMPLQANDALSDLQKLQEIMMKFYLSIACCCLLRSSNKPKRKEYNQAIAAAKMILEQVAPECAHNYENKRKLLQAEIHSCNKKDKAARQAYKMAILSAKSSKFLHEEGLACELAGKHCQRANDERQAKEYFSQALKCYQQWGCKVKVDSLTNELSDSEKSKG